MPKRSSIGPHVERPAAEAADLSDTSETEREKNPAAVALGRLGGLKGGKARARKLTPEQRSAQARKAAQKRWHKS
jgi:hypothetical protein